MPPPPPPPRSQPLPADLEQELAPDASALQPAIEAPHLPPHPAPPHPRTQLAEPEDTSPLAYAARTPARTRADLPVTIASILAIALPTVIDQLVTFGIRATDTIVAGHTGADEHSRAASAAAVGAMTYLQWFAFLTAAAIGVGATAIVARAVGAKRPRLANRVAGTACTAAFLISLIVAAFFFFFPRFTVHLLCLHGEAEKFATQYLHIMAFTVCFQSLTATGNACLRGAGDTLRPMITTITLTLVTIFAVPTLSFGWFGLPALGIRGNAYGTLIAFVIAALMTLVFLLSGSAGLKLRKRHFKIIPHMLNRVLKIGLPSGLESTLLWGGQILIVDFASTATDTALGPHFSGTTLAAHQATLTIESLAFLPGFGFGIACSALVGQYLGAKKPREAAHAVKLCQRLAVITMTLAAAVMVVIPHYMLHFLVDSDPVIRIGVIPLVLAGLAQPGFAIQIIKSAALRGAGDTIFPMIATVSGILLRCLIVLLLITLFSRYGHAAWGLTAVWIAIFLDLNYRALFNHAVFHTNKWQLQKV